MTLRSHGHRSTRLAALALATTLAAACHKDTVVDSRLVTTWVPTACPVDGKGLANYLALGDYDGNPQPPVRPLSAVGMTLPEIDTQARELVISATENNASWDGLAPVPDSGDVNVLVLPNLSPCPLSGQVGARTSSTLAPVGSRLAMIVGGNASPVPPTYVVDLTTGSLTKAMPDIRPPRIGATVTPFGDGALVAGGMSADGFMATDAQVYSPSTGGFDIAHPIALSGTRTNHAAVALADGRTILVGGSADPGGEMLLKTLDVIDPTTMSAQEEGFATLVTPRLDPIAVRLASGEILVAGGRDTTGASVTTMEWISPEAGTNRLQKPLPWGTSPFAMTALEGGGALVVESTFGSTWVVGALGTIQQTSAVLGKLTSPVLFGGARGAPVLWTGSLFVRWDPWNKVWGEFVTIGSTPLNVAGAIVSPDPGLGIWLDSSLSQLVALRFDTHNAYSELSPGGVVDLKNDMSPDELPTAGVVSLESDSELSVTSVGQAFVTDRTYEDVTVHVTSETAPGACVVLRSTSEEPVVLPDGAYKPGKVLDVQRSGANVSFSIDGGPFIQSLSTVVIGTRVGVGVRGFSETSPTVVTGIRIARPGTP